MGHATPFLFLCVSRDAAGSVKGDGGKAGLDAALAQLASAEKVRSRARGEVERCQALLQDAASGEADLTAELADCRQAQVLCHHLANSES